MANHAVMTFNRNLSFDIVYSFYKGYLSLIGPSIRRMMQMVEYGYSMHEQSSVTKEEGMGTFPGYSGCLTDSKNIMMTLSLNPI